MSCPGSSVESVREFVEGIRSLARAVEQAALVGGGSELDRAARSVEAFTSGLGALPIKEVLVSAGKAVETTGPLRRAAPDGTAQRIAEQPSRPWPRPPGAPDPLAGCDPR